MICGSEFLNSFPTCQNDLLPSCFLLCFRLDLYSISIQSPANLHSIFPQASTLSSPSLRTRASWNLRTSRVGGRTRRRCAAVRAGTLASPVQSQAPLERTLHATPSAKPWLVHPALLNPPPCSIHHSLTLCWFGGAGGSLSVGEGSARNGEWRVVCQLNHDDADCRAQPL